jgi:hypothetical protein
MVPSLEQHYTVAQIAKLWGISQKTVRHLFEDRPGVLKISQARLLPHRQRRPRTMLRIPASVACHAEKRAA